MPVRPLVPPAQRGRAGGVSRWDEDELARMVARCESFGLAAAVANLGISGDMLLGLPGREGDAEIVCDNIRTAGRAGLRCLTWNFTALRSSEGYGAMMSAGRGRADLRYFDARRLSTAPLPDVPPCTHDEMWERLQWTLDRIVPAAEEAGVLLALHPTDPPVSVYRGVAQICINFAEIKRFLAMRDSPSNTFFMDTGVATEWGEDAVEVIEYLGSRDRIGNVHFRNVRVVSGPGHYVEEFVNEGDCDMGGCMAALVRHGCASNPLVLRARPRRGQS